jgi:hypothetical protein
MSGDHNQHQKDQFPDATKMMREWVGLTDEDIKPLCDEWKIMFGSWTHDFACAIEAKLKEKNT